MLKKPEYIREKPKDYSFKDLNFIEKFLKEYFELLLLSTDKKNPFRIGKIFF
jgi:hypothetical protein